MVTTTTNGHETDEIAQTQPVPLRIRETVILPESKRKVMLRRATGMKLVRMGADIGVMQALAAKLTMDGGTGKPGEAGPSMAEVFSKDAETRDGFFALLDAYARACLVKPVVVERLEDVRDPERHIWFEDIYEEDKQFIMAWSQGGEAADDAAAFPVEADPGGAVGQDAGVDDLSGGHRVRPKAK